MGVWVRGHHAANFSHISKDAPENSTSFDTKVVVVGNGANMVLNEKPTKIWRWPGWKLPGLTWNQMNIFWHIFCKRNSPTRIVAYNFGPKICLAHSLDHLVVSKLYLDRKHFQVAGSAFEFHYFGYKWVQSKLSFCLAVFVFIAHTSGMILVTPQCITLLIITCFVQNKNVISTIWNSLHHTIWLQNNFNFIFHGLWNF